MAKEDKTNLRAALRLASMLLGWSFRLGGTYGDRIRGMAPNQVGGSRR